MQLSIVISAHNEGAALVRTVETCVDTLDDIHGEVVIADDASDDGSVDEVRRAFPAVRVERADSRRGASPTKAMGARAARGDVLLFLDGHTKPEPGSVGRLLHDVALTGGAAIVTPRLLTLDTQRWVNDQRHAGYGYRIDLGTLECGWLDLVDMATVRLAGWELYESPALIGCAFALSRELYDRLWGLDPDMRYWGVEDLDFGLKSWLMGYRILHDPGASIGHRFRTTFDNYHVPRADFLANQIRMARKNFTDATWCQWLESAAVRQNEVTEDAPEGLWARAWLAFAERRASADQERAYLLARREHDEFWYARRFGLDWPAVVEMAGAEMVATLPRGVARIGKIEPSPEPPEPKPLPTPKPPPKPVPGKPRLVFDAPAANTVFNIGADATMPTVNARAHLENVSPDVAASARYSWTIQVTFPAGRCNHQVGRVINSKVIRQTTTGGSLTVPFSQVRGGDLSIRVSVKVGKTTLNANSQGLRIGGTNPLLADLQAALPNDTMRRMASQESQCRHFDGPANGGTSLCPLFSTDNLGGAGVLQLTNPRPTDDEVWNWQASVAKGVTVFTGKVKTAAAYPAAVAKSPAFQKLVASFNAARVKAHQPAVTVTVPAFTSSGLNAPPGQLGQLELDAIRGFNGYAGSDGFGHGLHEFRVARDKAGKLIVDVAPGGTTGTTRWEQVPASARPQGVGDPDYVNHVLGSSPC